jgi:predicted amidohydrolase YtcJ
VNRLLLLLLSLILAACASAQPAPPPASPVDPEQSIIFHNGVILTMVKERPVAEAIAIRGDKVEALGSAEEILALQETGTTVIDLAGRTLMPGFVDAHTHILNDARSQGRSLDQAQTLALSNGITTLGDLYVDEPFLREIQAFAQRGGLRVRTSLYLVANTNCGRPMGSWYKKYPPTRQPGEMLRIGGVKIFTDGGSCGGVALSFELAPGRGLGDLWLAQDELNRMVAEAQAAGYQVAIHAIGDRAAAQAQEALAFALDSGPNIYRHRMEHVSVLRPEFIPRFGELGILPVLNGQYPVCTPFGPPVPEGYREWEWPWRALRLANPGLNIAWHSDSPFLSTNPFVHLQGFVTRTDVYQNYTCRAREWLLDDTLAVEEALSIMTIESAYALFRDGEVGSLEPGKWADVIVISGNPLTSPVDELKSLSVLATMVGGRFEFCNPRYAGLCPGYQSRTPLPLPDLRPPVPVRWLALVLALGLPLIAGLLVWRTAASRSLASLGGAAGVLGGGLLIWGWIIFSINEAADLATWQIFSAGTLLAVATAGLASFASKSRLGSAGLAIAWLGMAVFSGAMILTSWFQWENAWPLIFLGLLGHATGLVLFGLANWRAETQRPLHRLPLLIGLLGSLLPILLSFLAGESSLPYMILGFGLGLGWMLEGLLLLAAAQDRSLYLVPTE